MRTLGIEFGKNAVGLALSDPLGRSAFGLGLLRLNGESMTREIKAICEVKGVQKIVVGSIRSLVDGTLPSSTDQTRIDRVHQLAETLRSALGVQVELWEETNTPTEGLPLDGGTKGKRKKNPTPKGAAQILLQSYLDAQLESVASS